MKVLRIFGSIVLLLLVILIALYMYYLYTPKLKVPDLPGSFQQHNMEVAGLNRNFFSYRPVNLPLNAPVFFVLHGSTQTASDMRQSVAFEFESLLKASQIASDLLWCIQMDIINTGMTVGVRQIIVPILKM